MDERLPLRAVLRRSTLDGRRGVVRLHPAVLAGLGVGPWAPLLVEGRRRTGALVAMSDPRADPRDLACDELTLANAGVRDGETVHVSVTPEVACTRVTLAGPDDVRRADPHGLRFALLGKVLSEGDRVYLLPQDFSVPGAVDRTERTAHLQGLHRELGRDWTTAPVTVVGVEPPGPVIVAMDTAVRWLGDPAHHQPSGQPGPGAAFAPADLPAVAAQVTELRERLDLAFHHSDLLTSLGGNPQVGVLVTGAAGSGKATLVHSAARAAGSAVVRLWAPGLAALDPTDGARELARLAQEAAARRGTVLLIVEVEALAPREGGANPLLATLVETVQGLVAGRQVAVVGTSPRPEDVAPELVRPGLLDVHVAVPLPTRAVRRQVLAQQLARVPLDEDVDLDDVASRTPGFVAADLLALCQEAAVRSAERQRHASTSTSVTGLEVAVLPATVNAADIDAALQSVRPSSLADHVGPSGLTLEDVGGLEEVKEALTEAVLWPLTYPDTFERLGVRPPRGVLLYGPPGCGKTHLVRALAGSGQANLLVVKGAELLSKWVGESERAVRELFRRARESAPAIVFLDEVDALAPTRGSGGDSGTTERVVAALLTELDGLVELRDVVVIGATNRPDLIDPALLRPGRFDRLVHVPPPDAAGRSAVLRAAARSVPLADDVDLDRLARDAEGFSAADCAALLREAVLAAMRQSRQTTSVTAAHLQAAARVVRPSLDQGQVQELARFAAGRR